MKQRNWQFVVRLRLDDIILRGQGAVEEARRLGLPEPPTERPEYRGEVGSPILGTEGQEVEVRVDVKTARLFAEWFKTNGRWRVATAEAVLPLAMAERGDIERGQRWDIGKVALRQDLSHERQVELAARAFLGQTEIEISRFEQWAAVAEAELSREWAEIDRLRARLGFDAEDAD